MAAGGCSGFAKHCRFLLLFMTILLLCSTVHSIPRKLTIQNYTCPNNLPECKDKNISIVYVAAESQNHDNIVHFLWSAYGGPTVVTAYSSKLHKNQQKPYLTVNWEKLLGKNPEGAISFHTKPNYISAFMISSVLQFDDPDDNIYFTKTGGVIQHHLTNVVWRKVEIDDKGFNATFSGDFLGGTLSFMCWAADHDDRDVEPPRQRYSSNSTRFTFNLDGLTTNITKTDRLALEIVSIAESDNAQQTCVMEDESIDDEYSPAVFRTVVVNNTDSKETSFLAWKPVIYNNKTRSLKTQLPSYPYFYSNGKYKQEKISRKCSNLVAGSLKGPSVAVVGTMLKRTIYPMRLSYGQTKDGCYYAHKVMSWSGQAGYGRPLFDEISKTLLITIIAGLGIPVLLIMAGSVYVCVKKYKERQTASSYGRIN